MLQMLDHTFVNRATGLPHADFLITVYAARSSSPLRIYSDKEARQLVSSTGQVITDNQGRIKVWVPYAPAYELTVARKQNGLVLERILTSGIGIVESKSAGELSLDEVSDIRDLLEDSDGNLGVASVNGRSGIVVLTSEDIPGSNGSSPQDEGLFTTHFHFGDASPRSLLAIPANKVILQVDLIFLTAFNDPAGRVSVGDELDLNRLQSQDDNLPNEIGTYTTKPGHRYPSLTTLLLSITPGTSTVGEGLLNILYEP